MKEETFRIVTCLLLTGILTMQIISYQNRPPTYGDLVRTKDKEAKKYMMQKIPVVNANITQTLEVEVVNNR